MTAALEVASATRSDPTDTRNVARDGWLFSNDELQQRKPKERLVAAPVRDHPGIGNSPRCA